MNRTGQTSDHAELRHVEANLLPPPPTGKLARYTRKAPESHTIIEVAHLQRAAVTPQLQEPSQSRTMSKLKNASNSDATVQTKSTIPRSKLAHQIVSRLRDEIISGKWAPGESLPSHVLAAEFGVSHIPIREAFLVLESEGFISSAPNRKAIVTEPSVEETRDKLILLHTLEALAVELAASQASDADLASIAKLHEELEACFQAKDVHGYHDKNLEFHRRIVLAAKNQTLADFHQILTSHLEWARVRSQIRRDLLSDSPRQHRAIVDSLVARNGGAAKAAMEQHARSFGSALLHGVEEHADHR